MMGMCKRVKREETTQERFNRMTQTPVKKLVCTLAVPTIISMLVTSFYNMADTFFVGRIGTSATGAVGVVFSLMAVIQAIGFTFGHGSGNYVSRALGRQDMENASRMVSTGFFSALFFGAGVSVLGLIFLDPLVRILGATPTILPYARGYAAYILLGAPYMTATFVLNNQLRFQGSAMYAMVGVISGAVLNIALDPLFIFTFRLGVSGAAIATIISQFISFCILLYASSRRREYPHPLEGFYTEMGLLPGDPARRPAFFLAAGIGERGNDVPEFGGGPVWRCGDCSDVDCVARRDVRRLRVDWIRAGLPAGVRL